MSVLPSVKGWCPGAYRPMMSADGLVVRVRPRLARLSRAQAVGLCDLAIRFGSGFIDLTNRANLQIRGVAEADHAALLKELARLALLDADPAQESRRNILVSPFWKAGDLTARLSLALLDRLGELPALPAKVGFAVDCTEAPMLTRDPADFRIEQSENGLTLRADGTFAGRPVREDTAIDALIEMADWFAQRITPQHRRMAAVARKHELPVEWMCELPLPPALRPRIGLYAGGALVGAPFGQIDAQALRDPLLNAAGLRLTPWRQFALEGAAMPTSPAFLTTAKDPLGRVDACPGAPLCPAASVETRDLARRLAPLVQGSLHVSACNKGCARSRAADITLVGNAGKFDLVTGGCAVDTPEKTGLSPKDLLKDMTSGVI